MLNKKGAKFVSLSGTAKCIEQLRLGK